MSQEKKKEETIVSGCLKATQQAPLQKEKVRINERSFL